MTITAVIFDLDGTVLSNEDEYGIPIGFFLRVKRSLALVATILAILGLISFNGTEL